MSFFLLAESNDKTFALIHVGYLENSVGMNFSMAKQLRSEVTTHFLNTLIKNDRFSFVISR